MDIPLPVKGNLNEGLIIRTARGSDLPALLDIYNRSVLADTASFDIEPASLAKRKRWYKDHRGGYRIVVGIINDEIAGYAALSRFHPKPAYAISAELSIYVAEKFRRQGVAFALGRELLAFAEGRFYTVISLVTAENVPSLTLHTKLGFKEVGNLENCGRKFGRILDVRLFQWFSELAKPH